MGKYFGYAAIIVGIYILLDGLSLFFWYLVGGSADFPSPLREFASTNFITFILISTIISIIGLMITYYGWTDIKKWKTVQKLSY